MDDDPEPLQRIESENNEQEITEYERKRNASLKQLRKVSIFSLAGNLSVTTMQLTLGFVFFNMAMIADGTQSAIDSIATAMCAVAVFVAKPARDKKNNYGREKRESFFVLILAFLMFITAFLMIAQSIYGFFNIRETTFVVPLLFGSLGGITAKFLLFLMCNHYAKKHKSMALRADAISHLLDSVSTFAVLASYIIGIWTKNDLAESIAILILGLIVIRIGIRILRTSFKQLVDTAADETSTAKIRRCASRVKGVESVDDLQTRLFGNAVIVDIEIGVDGDMTVSEANEIIEKVEDEVESLKDVLVKDCNVHINPVSVDDDDDDDAL